MSVVVKKFRRALKRKLGKQFYRCSARCEVMAIPVFVYGSEECVLTRENECPEIRGCTKEDRLPTMMVMVVYGRRCNTRQNTE